MNERRPDRQCSERWKRKKERAKKIWPNKIRSFINRRLVIQLLVCYEIRAMVCEVCVLYTQYTDSDSDSVIYFGFSFHSCAGTGHIHIQCALRPLQWSRIEFCTNYTNNRQSACTRIVFVFLALCWFGDACCGSDVKLQYIRFRANKWNGQNENEFSTMIHDMQKTLSRETQTTASTIDGRLTI